jgi:hypothetical protein
VDALEMDVKIIVVIIHVDKIVAILVKAYVFPVVQKILLHLDAVE